MHVYSAPTANAGSDFSIIAPNTASLNGTATGGSGFYNYSWSPASLFINANQQNVVTANDLALTTIFTLEVTDTVSTCKNTDDVQVTVVGGPLTINPMASPDTICVGEQVQLSALVGGGTANYMYAWSSIPSGYSSIIANPIVTPTITTSYILSVFDGVSLETDTTIVEVGAIPNVSLNVSDPNYCDNGNTETFAATPVGGIYYGNGMSSNMFSPNVAGVGSHEIVYEFTSSLGCTNSDTIIALVQSAPLADAGTDIMIPCNGSGGLIGSPAVSNAVYQWNPSTDLAQANASQTTANPSFNTLYTVSVTDTISNCSSTDDVLVSVTGAPSLSVNNDTIICGGDSVRISAVSSASSFIWSNGVTSSSFIVSPSVTTVYTVTATGTSACSSVDSVIVTVNAPFVYLGPDITIVDTQSVSLDAGIGMDIYNWSTGDTTQFIMVQPYVNSQLGINKYVVEVQDVYGCSAKDSVYINYVLDINAINSDINLEIYPNPTKGKFILEFEGTISQTFSLEVVNMQAQIILEKKIHVNSSLYSESFDFSTWPKGIYLIRLKNENHLSTRKLIIE
jgi:hypothetical protein